MKPRNRTILTLGLTLTLGAVAAGQDPKGPGPRAMAPSPKIIYVTQPKPTLPPKDDALIRLRRVVSMDKSQQPDQSPKGASGKQGHGKGTSGQQGDGKIGGGYGSNVGSGKQSGGGSKGGHSNRISQTAIAWGQPQYPERLVGEWRLIEKGRTIDLQLTKDGDFEWLQFDPDGNVRVVDGTWFQRGPWVTLNFANGQEFKSYHYEPKVGYGRMYEGTDWLFGLGCNEWKKVN